MLRSIGSLKISAPVVTVTCVRPWKVTRRLVPEINSGEPAEAARAMLTASKAAIAGSPKVTGCPGTRKSHAWTWTRTARAQVTDPCGIDVGL